jgi:hypothetical protein
MQVSVHILNADVTPWYQSFYIGDADGCPPVPRAGESFLINNRSSTVQSVTYEFTSIDQTQPESLEIIIAASSIPAGDFQMIDLNHLRRLIPNRHNLEDL